MIPIILVILALIYFSRKPAEPVAFPIEKPAENPAAAVPTEELPPVTVPGEIEKVEYIHLPDLGVIIKKTGPVLTGNEVARLPDGSIQPVTEMPVSNQPAPFPAGTIVDIPGMGSLVTGYFVAPDGTWQTNSRTFITNNPDDDLIMMHIGGGGFITLDDGRVVPL